jgi:PAS domain S-box-containing protein
LTVVRFSSVAPDQSESRVLRILNLEDSPLDAELVQANLSEGGITCKLVRVQTRAAFAAALEKDEFDLIIADYSLPGFDGLTALEMARKRRPEVPFIVVSGALGEEMAIETLKSGATDYVLKHRLQRLVPAVRRAIHEAEERRKRERAEEALRRSEQQLRTLVEQIPAVIYFLHIAEPASSRTDPTLYFSPQIEAQSGYPPQAFVEDPELWIKLLHPEDRERVLVEGSRADETGEPFRMEYRQIARDGRVMWIRDEAVLVRDKEGRPRFWQGVMFDISDRKGAEEALKQSEELYRTVVEQAAENIFVIDPGTKRVLEANAALQRSLGYAPEELKGMTLYDVVAHDRESINNNIRHILAQRRYSIGERKYRRKDGSLVDVEVNASVIPYGGKEAMGIVAHDVTERKQMEENLRQSLGVLLAHREAYQILGSTLESEEIVSRLLEIMRGVSNLTAAVISIQDEGGRAHIWGSAGLEGLWRRARFAPEVAAARWATLEHGEQRLFRLQHPELRSEHLVGLCLPLRSRNRVLGALEVYGPESLVERDAVDILGSLASQAASALENAQLYEKLEEREYVLQDLVGKLFRAQEEERRRVAYEVHDGLAQVASAAHQHLQAFARRYSPGTERGRRDLERILRLVRGTVSDARRIIANLRPTVLDDLGLAATISQEVESLRAEGYQVDYEEDLREKRLPDAAEIALYRVVQEALTNMRKHAQTRRVRIELRRWEQEVRLEVRDYGRGFDPTAQPLESGPGERVGLVGMQERVSALGGTLEIHSRAGVGTSVAATVSLRRAAR